MRLFLFVLLYFAIAFHGSAYAHAFEQPCLVKQGTTAVVTGHSSSVSIDDCCNDADMAAKTGSPCKTGQACSPTGAFMGLSSKIETHALPASLPVQMVTLIPPSLNPSAIWRPPTLS